MKTIPFQLEAERAGRWNEKLEAVCEYWIILIMMEDALKVPPCRWYLTFKSVSDLQKLFEVMGFY